MVGSDWSSAWSSVPGQCISCCVHRGAAAATRSVDAAGRDRARRDAGVTGARRKKRPRPRRDARGSPARPTSRRAATATADRGRSPPRVARRRGRCRDEDRHGRRRRSPPARRCRYQLDRQRPDRRRAPVPASRAPPARLQADITIKLIVDGTGRVTTSRLQAPHYLFEKGLLGCAQRALGRMRFPSRGAPTTGHVSGPPRLRYRGRDEARMGMLVRCSPSCNVFRDGEATGHLESTGETGTWVLDKGVFPVSASTTSARSVRPRKSGIAIKLVKDPFGLERGDQHARGGRRKPRRVVVRRLSSRAPTARRSMSSSGRRTPRSTTFASSRAS